MKTQTLTLILTIGLAAPAAAQTHGGRRRTAAHAAQRRPRGQHARSARRRARTTTPEIAAAARAAAADARDREPTVARGRPCLHLRRTRAQAWEQIERGGARAAREGRGAAREGARAARERARDQLLRPGAAGARPGPLGPRGRELRPRDRDEGTKADAALYWKAYAQNKLGQRPEALATINVLLKDYPKSRYLSDAKALEVEVKRISEHADRPGGADRRGDEDPGDQRARRTARPRKPSRCCRRCSRAPARRS